MPKPANPKRAAKKRAAKTTPAPLAQARRLRAALDRLLEAGP